MSDTFQLTGSISVALHRPSGVARALIKVFNTPSNSLDDLMSTFLPFLPELTTPFEVTDDYDPRPAFLAAAVMQRFYTPMSPRPTYEPILIQHMEAVAAAVVPAIFHTLEFSFTDPRRQGYHLKDTAVLSTLAALLQHETGIAEFADIGPAMLTLKIKTIIWMWLEVSRSNCTNVLDIDLVKIIHAFTDYAPTQGPLEEAVASIPRSHLLAGLNHLNAAVDQLEDPNFTFLPNSLLTNMRGIGVICMVRPRLRNYLFGRGLINALCSLLAHAIIDEPLRVPPEEWPVEMYGAYHFVLAISDELCLLFKDEVTSPSAVLQALNGRLFHSIRWAVHHFGRTVLTPWEDAVFAWVYLEVGDEE